MPAKSKLYNFLKRGPARRALLLDTDDLPSQGHDEVRAPKPLSDRPWNNDVSDVASHISGKDGPKTDEAVKQWRRDLLLSPQGCNNLSRSKLHVRSDTQHSTLESMKEELCSLVIMHEECRSTGERSQVRRKREKLIADIEKLETKQRRHDRDSKLARSLVQSAEPSKRLPEAIGASEKRQLKWAVERARKGRLGLEKPRISLKRHWKEDDTLLDGEERLRLGKRVDRKPVIDVTGHWISNIHTHYLCAREDMSMESMNREDVSAYLTQRENEDIKQESESESFGNGLVLKRSELESVEDAWNGLEGTEWDWEH